MHTVVETQAYLRNAVNAGLTDVERMKIVDAVAKDPHAGDLIKGTSGLRKRRFAGRGKGKSGGYRVIVAFIHDEVPVFLMAIYGKGAKADLSAAERNEFARWMQRKKAEATKPKQRFTT